MTKRIDELVQHLCGAADHPLAPLLRSWCQADRRFLAFAEENASKIRRKVRLAPEAQERGDLSAELAVAAALLRDRRAAVQYEPPHAAGGRGPDFHVLWKTHTALHVEVTRLRLSPEDAEDGQAALKLARTLSDKVAQLPAGAAGVLAVFVPNGVASGALVPAAIRVLDATLQPGITNDLPAQSARAFARGRSRLSAVLLCVLAGAPRTEAPVVWLNAQAKHPLPPELARSLLRAPP